MGILTTVSVILMDVFVLVLERSGHCQGPNEISFLLILNRVMMVGLGMRHWIYGYIILYLLYAIVFINLIAKDYFPLQGEIVTKNPDGWTLKSLKNPDFLLLMISAYFFALMLIVTNFDLERASGVNLKEFHLHVDQKEYVVGYIETAGLTIFTIVCLSVSCCFIRAMIQKAQGGNF